MEHWCCVKGAESSRIVCGTSACSFLPGTWLDHCCFPFGHGEGTAKMFLFLEFVRDGVVIKVQFFCVEREISGRVEEGWGVYVHMYTVKMCIHCVHNIWSFFIEFNKILTCLFFLLESVHVY